MTDRVFFFDTETTNGWLDGVNITEVVEIGWVLTDNGEVIDQGSSLTSSLIPINSFTENLIEISNEMIKDSPSLHQYIPDIFEKSKDAIIVCHNTVYDMRVVKETLERRESTKNDWYKEFISRRKLDTMYLFRKAVPDAPNRKLKTAMAYAGLNPEEKKHRALPDAQFTKDVFFWMWPKLQELYKVSTVQDLARVYHGEKPTHGQMSLI